MDYLNMMGAFLTVVMGGLGMFLPAKAAQLTGLQAVSVPGRSEFRATFGGFFLFAGAVCLIAMVPVTFLMLGLAWAGAALGRIVSIFADDANTKENWVAVIFEAAFAVLLLAGAPTREAIRLLG